jgi:hypothetical protein
LCPRAVEEGAVCASEVFDLPSALKPAQERVNGGRPRMGDDQPT